MEANDAKEAIKDLVTNLLSRDPVLFNSTINSKFSADATYQGHGLKIKGASNIKHAAWLLNVFDVGSPANFYDYDVTWDQRANTAHVHSTRHLRPRFFPLFQFAIPTLTTLRFSPGDRAKDEVGREEDTGASQGELLYCTSFEDSWPLDSFLQSIPVIRAIYTLVWIPIATFLVLQLSNLAFDVWARVSFVHRRVIEPSIEKYGRTLVKGFPDGLTDGFDSGTHLAQGLGGSGVDLCLKMVRRPLEILEWGAQSSVKTVNLFLPISLQLPVPSIFQDSSQQRSLRVRKGESHVSELLAQGCDKKLSPPEFKFSITESTEFEEPSQDGINVAASPRVLKPSPVSGGKTTRPESPFKMAHKDKPLLQEQEEASRREVREEEKDPSTPDNPHASDPPTQAPLSPALSRDGSINSADEAAGAEKAGELDAPPSPSLSADSDLNRTDIQPTTGAEATTATVAVENHEVASTTTQPSTGSGKNRKRNKKGKGAPSSNLNTALSGSHQAQEPKQNQTEAPRGNVGNSNSKKKKHRNQKA